MEHWIWARSQRVEQHPAAATSCLEPIGSFPLFRGLSETICCRIASAATTRAVARHESVFMQRDRIDSFMLLASGSVKLVQVGGDGGDRLFRVCGPGEIIAGSGLSGVSRHKYSAYASEESKVLSWRNDTFLSYMQGHPRLALNLSQILYGRLSELETRVREFTSEEITRRVALLLVRLSKTMGKRTCEGIRVAIKQEEVAQMAGLTVFTVSRMLSRWSDRGLVSTRREAIIIPDVRRLAHREETRIKVRGAR